MGCAFVGCRGSRPLMLRAILIRMPAKGDGGLAIMSIGEHRSETHRRPDSFSPGNWMTCVECRMLDGYSQVEILIMQARPGDGEMPPSQFVAAIDFPRLRTCQNRNMVGLPNRHLTTPAAFQRAILTLSSSIWALRCLLDCSLSFTNYRRPRSTCPLAAPLSTHLKLRGIALPFPASRSSRCINASYPHARELSQRKEL